MRILRAENYRRMKWKNGGGETAEIAVFPEGAVFDDFGWRVSMATVASGGPFSVFAGIDRTLSVLEGEGIVLEVEGSGAKMLTPVSGPFSFPGDAATFGKLTSGPITDLNVMTRRGQWAHKVTRHAIDGAMQVNSSAPVTMLICAAPSLLVAGPVFEEQLGRHDAAVLADTRAPVQVEGQGHMFLIELERLT